VRKRGGLRGSIDRDSLLCAARPDKEGGKKNSSKQNTKWATRTHGFRLPVAAYITVDVRASAAVAMLISEDAR
jgi:hypothetical protein